MSLYANISDFYNTDDNTRNERRVYSNMNIEKITSFVEDIGSPEIFGNSAWLFLHTGAMRYPINANKFTIERMKGFILGLPYILPCIKCSEHAIMYTNKYQDKLNEICSGRENLFAFFVNFHNYVNERLNKPIMTIEEAKRIYSGSANITITKFS